MTRHTRFDGSQLNSAALATLVLLAFSVLLGGASRDHALRLALVELIALPLVVLAMLKVRRAGISAHSFPLGILACAVALPLFQLLPLPPAIWTRLPGRSELELALKITSLSPGWIPLSLTPDRTWGSVLALLPPIGMFLGVLATPSEQQRRLIYMVLLLTAAAVLLGTLQLASGGEQFYPWRTTGAGSVVGFFANRNHLATLCLVCLPFAAVLAGRAIRRDGASDRLKLWLALLFITMIIVALGVIKSRAGIVLLGPVLAASLVATWIASGRSRPKVLFLGLMGGIAIAMATVAIYAFAPILARFDSSGVTEGRFENWPVVAEAANTYLPLGSGVGSFDAVYRSVEPLQRLSPKFFNQAHNDYLETWLETGWMGAGLIIAFFVWYGRRSWAAWRARPSMQRDLQRASTIALGAILLHSAADYPLRTATMLTIFTMCCAILEFAGTPDEDSLSRRKVRTH